MSRPELRRDIEGLRALAILTVVLFHAKVPGFSGGFVGVDLFFVLSGYLISGLLLDEHRRSGTIGFASFYARRARRLLPASAAMLLVVTLAGLWLSAPSEQQWFAAGVSFASLYMSNIQFIRSGADYYDTTAERHPLLHTWSLSVEEQFYFIWPLAIAAMLLLAARSRRARPTLSIGLVTIAGFAAAEWARNRLPLEGFYFSAFRLWEFSSGALLAAHQRGSTPPGERIASIFGWLGLALVVGSSTLMDANSAFPGVGALPVVLGTMLVLYGTTGRAESRLHRLLGLAPFQTLGRLSYSIYLWHWPMLTFGAALLPYATVWHRIGFLLASVAVSELSYRWVESPLRHHAWLSATPRRSIVAAIAVSLLVASIGALWKFEASAWRRTSTVTDAAWTAAKERWPLRAQEPDDAVARPVEAGAPDGRETWVLLGDSHAEVWYPALSEVLAATGRRLVLLTKSACPAMEVHKRWRRQPFEACDNWRDDALRRIGDLHPRVLLLASREQQPFADDDWAPATEALIRKLPHAPEAIVVIRGMSDASAPMLDCLSAAAWRGIDEAAYCSVRPAAVEQGGFAALKRAVGDRAGWYFEDWTKFFCTAESCSPRVASGAPLFADEHHLSRPAVLEAVPRVKERFDALGLLPR